MAKSNNIYGSNPTSLADRIANDALKGLKDVDADVHGETDSRVKTPNMGVGTETNGEK